MSAPTQTEVYLRLGASPEQTRVVRSLVETALLIEDWELAEIAEVTAAVVEICSQITSRAARGTWLELTLDMSWSRVDCQVAGVLQLGEHIEPESEGWRLVRAVTDRQAVVYDDQVADDGVGVGVRVGKWHRPLQSV